MVSLFGCLSPPKHHNARLTVKDMLFPRPTLCVCEHDNHIIKLQFWHSSSSMSARSAKDACSMTINVLTTVTPEILQYNWSPSRTRHLCPEKPQVNRPTQDRCVFGMQLCSYEVRLNMSSREAREAPEIR